VASFERAVAFVLIHEGEWSEDPAGGKTRFGLSSKAHPDLNLAALTREQAIEVYRARYWSKIRGDALPEALGLAMLDYAVLQGTPTAVRALQAILGVPVDGRLGPQTLYAIDARPPGPLTREVLAARKLQLMTGDPKYRLGWIARLLDLALEV